MPEIDFTTLTDADLESLRLQVAAEQDRRVRLSRLPGQISAAVAEFLASGGDPTLLPSTSEIKES